MGGAVSVVIRNSKGKISKMDHSTGAVMGFCLSDKFYEEDKDYIKAFKDDKYEKGILAPLGYGLVVIDYMTKTILNNQGYSSLTKFSLSTLRAYAQRTNAYRDEDNLIPTFKRMLSKDMIASIDIRFNKDNIINKKVQDKKTVQNFLDNGSEEMIDFNVQVEGWEVINYQDKKKDYKKMQKKIVELGIEPTKEDKRGWKEWYVDLEESMV